MVNESIDAINQSAINHSSLHRTKTNKRVRRNKHIHHNNNAQTEVNFTAPNLMNNCFTVLHQNIRGIRDKTSELIGSMLPVFPQVVCLTENHLKDHEIENVSMPYYTLGANFAEKI